LTLQIRTKIKASLLFIVSRQKERIKSKEKRKIGKRRKRIILHCKKINLKNKLLKNQFTWPK
jgi:hypothetical protein